MKEKKEVIPKKHWEQHYSTRISKSDKKTQGADYDPQEANSRRKTYNPVNAQDH
jgi:hypothetical protein